MYFSKNKYFILIICLQSLQMDASFLDRMGDFCVQF